MPIRIIDDSSSDFVYSGSWLRTGTWSSSDGQRGTVSSTSEQGASVTFAFPVPATAFRFYGLKSRLGAYYAVCVDCNPSSPQWTFISAYNATDDGTSPPVYFYHHSWPTPGFHRVTVVNQSDRRGIPSGNSVLSLDRFELDVPVAPPSLPPASQASSNVASSSAVQPSTTVDAGNGGGGGSSASVTTQVTSQGGALTTLVVTQNVTAGNGASSTPAAGGAAASITTPASASASAPNLQSQTVSPAPSDKPLDANSNNNPVSSSKSTPLGGIVGGVVGGLVIIALVIFLFFWLKKRKKGRSPATGVTPLGPPEVRVLDPTHSGEVTSHEFRSNEKANRYHSGHLYSSHTPGNSAGSNPAASNAALLSALPPSPPASTLSYAPSQPPSESLSNENPALAETRRVRELDAGPVPLQYDGNAETLPPEYGQVFSGRDGQQHIRNPSSSQYTESTTLTSTTSANFLSSQNSSQPLQPVRRT